MKSNNNLEGQLCPDCKKCDECGLFVHQDKPKMHHGACKSGGWSDCPGSCFLGTDGGWKWCEVCKGEGRVLKPVVIDEALAEEMERHNEAREA